MDSERTACWPRHKRRVYAQAEGFENPQRADYRRLINFLAKNSGLCQKAILNTARVPEFAAVRTILNRKLKETAPNPEVDLLARELLKEPAIQEAAHLGDIADLATLDNMEGPDILAMLQPAQAFYQEEEKQEHAPVQNPAAHPTTNLASIQTYFDPEAEISAVGDLYGIIHDDSQEVEEMLTGEKRPWDDLSDLLQDMSPVNDLLREEPGLYSGIGNPAEIVTDPAIEDLFHGKPNSRGRFGRRRVNRSLSSLVIEHVLKNTEEDQEAYEECELTNDPDVDSSTQINCLSKQEETSARYHAYEQWYQTVSDELRNRAEKRASSRSSAPSGQVRPSVTANPDLSFAATPDPVADPSNFAGAKTNSSSSEYLAAKNTNSNTETDFISPLASPVDRADFISAPDSLIDQKAALSPQEGQEVRIATAPLSRTEAMLEKWFRALDDRMHSVSLLEESSEEGDESNFQDDESATRTSVAYTGKERVERLNSGSDSDSNSSPASREALKEPQRQKSKYGSYADELADNPAELLKQLEKIARGSNADLLDLKRKNRGSFIKQSPQPCLLPLSKGKRKEIYPNGAVVVKDSLGKVLAVRSGDKVSITFTYDNSGNLIAFSRYNADGSLHTYGERDHHGVLVRDPCGRVRAQGESMTCDPRGCLTIRKMDGQFWCVDLVRSIHIERRILEDLDGNWSSLTALLTYDGFRMATRFQELNDSYRRYGDWLAQSNASTFRFYGRDGSMIQFDSDEELQSLRPSSIKPPGSKQVDEELRGRRKARTAWDSVHEYVSQYLAVL
ncbi:hypothetical protein GC174_01860 [bacterium]|nr:hypothetical protein [bacterium]